MVLERASVARGAQLLARDVPVTLVAGPVRSVRAGAADPGFWPEAQFPEHKVPARGPEAPRERERRVLYEAVAKQPAAAECAAVHERLQRDFPDEWLLRWNALRALTELGCDAPRRRQLAAELRTLEERYQRRNPIAMGLRYLGYADEAA